MIFLMTMMWIIYNLKAFVKRKQCMEKFELYILQKSVKIGVLDK